MTTKKLGLYEGMYIINAALSDDARGKALEKIKNGIVERGGEIHKLHEQGRRRLAYEINKQREGFYYVIYFSVKPSAISEMWQDYHLHEDLIRFMTLEAKEIKETLEFKPLEQS